MLSLFPELLFLSPFSGLALRIALVAVLALTAWAHVSRPAALPRAWAVLEFSLAIALLSGAWTQAAALLTAIWFVAGLFFRDLRIFPKSTILLALIMSLSLLITGPGAFAFDLPL